MLKPHQIKSLKFKLGVDRSLDLSEMGTGKTLTSLTLIEHLNETALIICPAYLRLNWLAEIRKFFKKTAPTAAIITKMNDLVINKDCKILICSYEALKFMGSEFQKRNIIIVDEAHYLCNLESGRSRFFHNYNWTATPKKLVLLTGTPIRNHIPDLFSLLAAIRPPGFLERFGKLRHFARHFSFEQEKYIGTIKKTEYVGVRNTEELKAILNSCTIRTKLSDIAEMPPYITEILRFESSKINEAKQNALWDEFKLAGEGDGERTLENATTAKAFNALVKSEFTIKIVQDFFKKYPDESIVIFTDHKDSAAALGTVFGVDPITGATPAAKRQDLVDGFQRGETKVIVGTIGAMGTGFTLHRARVVIYNDQSWVPASNAQADCRIYRVGQHRTCVKYVVTCGDIDYKIGKTLVRKTQIINKVLV